MTETPDPVKRDFDATLQDLRRSLKDAVPVVTRILTASWNLFMYALVFARLMPAFRKWPWLFLVLGFVLLAFIFPVGVLFVAAAFAGYSSKYAQDDYIVPAVSSQSSDN